MVWDSLLPMNLDSVVGKWCLRQIWKTLISVLWNWAKKVWTPTIKLQLNQFETEHRGYVKNKLDTTPGFHFCQPGHGLTDLAVIVLEQIKKNCDEYKKERESYSIRKFQTVHKDMNWKLDGVGPVDNRPSTDYLHQLQKLIKYDSWHMTCDMWHVTCDIWHMTCDMWHVVEGEHSLKMSAP